MCLVLYKNEKEFLSYPDIDPAEDSPSFQPVKSSSWSPLIWYEAMETPRVRLLTFYAVKTVDSITTRYQNERILNKT